MVLQESEPISLEGRLEIPPQNINSFHLTVCPSGPQRDITEARMGREAYLGQHPAELVVSLRGYASVPPVDCPVGLPPDDSFIKIQ